MLAFNPGEPRFQNGTRPSQGREKDFLWGRCFLQLSVNSTSAESPTLAEAIREGVCAVRDQLLSEQSCISSWGKGALHRLSFALAMAGVFSRQAGLRQCDAPSSLPKSLQHPSVSSRHLTLARLKKLSTKTSHRTRKEVWDQHHVSHYPWLPPQVQHYAKWVVQATDDLAQHKEQSKKHRLTPNPI